MEVVIKISEEVYQKIKETSAAIIGRRSSKRIDSILFNAVYTGTPLQKGHGRLIDADQLPIDIEWSDVENAPTIIEADKGETE